jgi:hypothetical protein
MKMSWLARIAIHLTAAPLVAQTAELPVWIRAHPAGQVVDLELTATRPAGSASGLLNGEHNGGLQIVVPRGWTVRWTWVNADSSAHHSLVVMTEREKLPTEGGTAAFTNAMTRSLKGGLMPGAKDVTSFVAEDAGWFWMLCGVPGHAIAGEFIGLRIDPAATGVAVNRK